MGKLLKLTVQDPSSHLDAHGPREWVTYAITLCSHIGNRNLGLAEWWVEKRICDPCFLNVPETEENVTLEGIWGHKGWFPGILTRLYKLSGSPNKDGTITNDTRQLLCSSAHYNAKLMKVRDKWNLETSIVYHFSIHF